MQNELIFGKDPTENIISIQVEEDSLTLFMKDGTLQHRPYKHWFLTSRPGKYSIKLEGNQHFQYLNEFDLRSEYSDAKQAAYKKLRKEQIFNVYNEQEQAMLRSGITLFKGMKVQDLRILSVDIESVGLMSNETHQPIAGNKAEVFIISNAFRDETGLLTRKMFSLDEYENSADMIRAWCEWVVKINPHVLCGHNIFSYDIPYLNYVWRKSFDYDLPLGFFGDSIKINEKSSKFRKDQSQNYEYYNITCTGRNIIDTMFLAIKYDNVAKKYNSYGLKQIIKDEGLEKVGRQYYDASKIASNWSNFEERQRIKVYAEEDADDALKLFDLMIAPTFYSAQMMPMSLQHIVNSASGRQINSMMVRSYLQLNHSIALASEKPEFQGAISFGIPGIYSNCLKVDFSGLYPSIMREYKVFDKYKDPNNHFGSLVEYFAEFRLKYKKLFKETNDRYYDDLQTTIKVLANSCYGFLSTNGLNYNSPDNASFITAKGRELLNYITIWATSRDLDYWKGLINEKS